MKARIPNKVLTAAMAILLAAYVAPTLADPPEYWCYVCSTYGDGSDGDYTVPPDRPYLTSDMNFRNLTVLGGATLDTRGHTVRVCGTLTNHGTITDNYCGGAGGDGGICGAGADPYLHGSPPGCQARYHYCQLGEDGEPGEDGCAPQAGRGGDGGGGGGGGGGAWCDTGIPQCAADADGGDGGSGGDGGNGGGYVRIYAWRFENHGVIEADGERGGDGQDAPPPGLENCGAEYFYWQCVGIPRDIGGGGGGGGGGGCGGDGGIVEIVLAQFNQATGEVHASGGNAGDGGQGGAVEGPLSFGCDLLGGHQDSCPGGGGCGAGGHGGRGAHEEGDCPEPGDPGQDGLPGADGTVTATLCCWPGDLDGDCDVDLEDLGGLLTAYGCCVNDPCYNPCADFDNNDCVDLSDLAALLANYGCGPEPM